jgi:hypothetical protein
MVLAGTVTVNEKKYSLQRKVRFSLRERMNLGMECNPDAIAKGMGKPFDVLLKVPGGLGDAMFPLEFELEAENQSMTPDLGDDLPVKTGASIVPGRENRTTIGFVRTLSWEEYEAAVNEGGFKAIPCHFKSNKSESATRIYAKNKYFNLANTQLANYVPAAFTDLEFSQDNVPYGVGQELDFSFTMSRIPEQGYVTVTLGGLEPAPSETRLTYLGVVDGKAQYSFAPSALNNTLKLATIYEVGDVDVSLKAYRFEDASASLQFAYGTFGNLQFSPARIPGVVGATVNFSFTMSRITDNIIVTLTELQPAPGENRLTLISGNRYSFSPAQVSNTLKLVATTAMDGDVVRVHLEALGFTDASATATRVITIPKGNINVGPINNTSNNVTFTLYASDPGDSANPADVIGSFTAKSKKTNPNDIEISKELYNKIVANGGNVYVRYRTGSWFNTNYYVAGAKLDDLLNKVVTLNFKEI